MGACLTVAALVAATAGGAYADDTGGAGATAGAALKDVDGDTRYTYTDTNDESGVLGDETSTRYSGRVWTDKTVTTKGQTFTNPNDSEGQTTTPVTVQNDSDFLVTYSALATSTETVRQRPTDTVFVLDFSMTMGQRMDGSEIKAERDQVDQTRMWVMLNALEDAMQDLAKANNSNRIGIVVFLGYLNGRSQTERVLLPLTQVTEFNTSTPSGDSVYTTPDKFFTITDMKTNGQYTQMGVRCNLQTDNNTLWTGNYTPTQAGLYDAMQMLLDAEVTSGQERQPNVVLMSDGVTNAISVNTKEYKIWYEDVDTGDTGARITDSVPGASSSPFAAFATVLMGSYLDEKVEEHYGRDNSVYTIGVTGNSSSDQIRFALDPEPYLSGTIIPSSDSYKVVEKSRDAIDEYLKGGDTVTVPGVSISATFKIVKDDEGRVVPQDFDYVDTYYEAHKADDLENAFADIAGNIISRARYPIDTSGTSDGYITYEDPIGEYMQVKDVKTLLYMGADAGTPTKIETDTNGNKVTTYTFNHKFTSPVDGQTYDTSQIIIKLVETTTDHRQTLKVMIPYRAIPMRVNRLTLNSDGTVESNTINGNLPLRLCYTVGLRDGIDPDTLKNNGNQAVSDTYIQTNIADDGKGIYLYSNDFTRADGTTTATATAKAKVTFTPAKDNPFYFIQEDTPLYTDEECKTHATEVTDNGTYYFRITYYQGTETKTAAVKRAGSLMSGYVKEKNGAMYLQSGAPRLGYLQDLTVSKDDNLTGTASTYREPTFEGDPRTGRFVVYLGNNGRMTLHPTMDGKAQVNVQKTLKGRPWTKNDAFTFTITPQNGAPLPDKGDDITVNQETKTATLTVRAPQKGATGTGSFTVTIPSGTKIPENGMQYVYKIEEQKGDAPSMDYDAGTLTVTIKVTADGKDPDLRLDTVVAYQYQGADTGDTDSDGEFTNTFTRVSKLPFTGGRGTGLAVLLGGIVLLMLAGGAWLLARRNRN
ncbi:Spy0128 family protein [Bifidobacterium pullorum]|uniref:Spy0128 family protein n=1 Tax=Bifidobacterium pullorum TaxID=78448 RepID=UPI00195981C7|nr:FctA domain-containing protein [Bifidobacterium pullorum]